MASDTRHPLLADTSSLIAVANTDQWDVLAESLALTTTNVCKHELQNHVNSTTYAPEGSREQYLKEGSQRVLDHLDDDSSSYRYSAETHPFTGGRKRVRSVRQPTDYDRADSPTFMNHLVYI